MEVALRAKASLISKLNEDIGPKIKVIGADKIPSKGMVVLLAKLAPYG
jgi:hypothetical protein